MPLIGVFKVGLVGVGVLELEDGEVAGGFLQIFQHCFQRLDLSGRQYHDRSLGSYLEVLRYPL